MSTIAERHDAQVALNRAPHTPSPLDQAWAHLLDEAERNVRRTGDAVLHGAVVAVKEMKR